jgi:hypothetical protein
VAFSRLFSAFPRFRGKKSCPENKKSRDINAKEYAKKQKKLRLTFPTFGGRGGNSSIEACLELFGALVAYR